MGLNEKAEEEFNIALNKEKEDYQKPQMPSGQVDLMKRRMEEAKMKNNKNRKKRIVGCVLAAAAAAAIFIALPNTSENAAYAMSNIPVIGKLVDAVTFRNYKYDSARHHADIEVPELAIGGTEAATGGTEAGQDVASQGIGDASEGTGTRAASGSGADGSGTDASGGTDATGNSGSVDSSGKDGTGTKAEDGQLQENLQKTADEINAEIQEITDQIVAEFEADIENEEGYQDVMVKHEVISSAEDYFTLKLICYQAAGSGAEWDYFYTIDLNTGNRLALSDLFEDGADYITPISENIKEQMREQMDADESVMYWLDDEEVPEWNFQQITDETSFYLNEDGNIVICFDEGDVAPMYMGCVEFVIPDETTDDIRVNK